MIERENLFNTHEGTEDEGNTMDLSAAGNDLRFSKTSAKD